MFGEPAFRIAFAAGAAVLAAACGSGLRSAVHFDGRAQPELLAPAEVVELESLPTGYESLGEVSAHCRLTEGQRALDGAWLSDVDCSEGRLVRALRETVAEVGGELMIARRCGAQVHKGALRQLDVACRAEVGRPTQQTLASRSPTERAAVPSSAVLNDERPRASAAWRIRVDFTAAPAVEPRAARRGELVQELAVLPVSHVRLGDVVTRCARGCSERAVIAGLRTVAGRMGATDLVDVRCASRGEGMVCAGTAAAYEVDPEREPRAR